jgi:hypothetical protein
MPLARQLRVLDLTGSRLDANVLALFGDTDAVSGLETLVLPDTGMDDEMAQRLSEVATFRDLKRLSVDVVVRRQLPQDLEAVGLDPGNRVIEGHVPRSVLGGKWGQVHFRGLFGQSG